MDWYDYRPSGYVDEEPASPKYNPLRFAGTYRHEVDGHELYQMWNRWYDPELGRFTQRDPIEAVWAYAYAAGNPTNFIDPAGLHHRWWHKAYQAVQRPISKAAPKNIGKALAGVGLMVVGGAVVVVGVHEIGVGAAMTSTGVGIVPGVILITSGVWHAGLGVTITTIGGYTAYSGWTGKCLPGDRTSSCR